MKKDILIYTYNLDIGGIERSLIGLLNSIDYNRYNVDLYIFKHEGEFLKDIPKEVNILEENKITQFAGIPIIEVFRKGEFYIGFGRLYAKLKLLLRKKVLHKNVSGEYMSQITYPLFCKKIKKLNKHYDCALSFYWPHYIVKDKVLANIKLGWIHTDYSQIYPDTKKELSMWNELNYVVAVSEDCRKSFLEKYPELKEKTIVIENILSEEYVRSMANKIDVKNEIDNNSKTICSVGRFCDAKNFTNIPNICKLIKDKGVNIKWYLIGYGPEENRIKNAIKKEHVEENVIILGKKENPYPYIKACDIYVQPSKYEGKAVAVREAQILCKPVIITNYDTAHSQVRSGKDGIIVNMDNQSIANGICELLENDKELQRLVNFCKDNSFENSEEFNKIEEIL